MRLVSLINKYVPIIKRIYERKPSLQITFFAKVQSIYQRNTSNKYLATTLFPNNELRQFTEEEEIHIDKTPQQQYFYVVVFIIIKKYRGHYSS